MSSTRNRTRIRWRLATATLVVTVASTSFAQPQQSKTPARGQPQEISDSDQVAGAAGDGAAAATDDSPSAGPPPWLEAASMSLDDVRSGELLWRVGGALVPMPVLDMEVSLDVSGIVVHGKVVQRFENRAQQVIEAIYVFPLPEGAAVHRMEMRIGNRRIVSVVQERKQARKTYKRAKSEGKKAALVEQERPNLFTTSIANINPGESVSVLLEYVEDVEYRDGTFSLAFPLTFTPRYTPDAFLHVEESTGQATVVSSVVPDANRVSPPFQEPLSLSEPRARFEATIDMGMPLESLRCVSHPVRVTQSGRTWFVTFEDTEVVADRDVLLEWRPAIGAVPEVSLVTEEFDGERYALCLFVPPERAPEDGGLPTETVFVIDTSGSMGGPSIRQAREALVAAIDRLRPTDRFNIVAFNDRYTLFRRRFENADSAMRERAQDWARRLDAGGGTMIDSALERAMKLFDSSESGRVQRIVFLTDGAVSNEAEVHARIAAGLGPVRLHCVGIGPAPNRYLMRKMASYGQGLCEFIGHLSEAENRVDRVFARLARPVLSDIEVAWLGPGAVEAYPSSLPNLHAGDPLVVALRLPEGRATGRIEVRGRTHDGPVRMTLDFDTRARNGAGIATRWARRKVASLMDDLHGGADSAAVRKAVVDVAQTHHLVTRYTSLVAVEAIVTAVGAASTAQVANVLPHGSQLMRIGLPQGGTDLPLRRLASWVATLVGLLLVCVAIRLRACTCQANVPRRSAQ
jgi:Ca-activated chloride channel family protein